MYAIRLSCTRHARFWERVYHLSAGLALALAPLLARIGHQRLEPAAAALERATKGPLFDCKMCGQCVLSQTGMSCPTNCAKGMRNGPCGGVRPDGHCEVVPTMRCVWVEAWEGSARMADGAGLRTILPPLDHRLSGRSAWLEWLRRQGGGRP